jgi:dienelactone hydrolase
MKRSLAVISLFLAPGTYGADLPLPVAGAQPLDWTEEDLSGRMMDGAHRFVERKIAEAGRDRGKRWHTSSPSAASREVTAELHRKRLREIIGAAGSRPVPRMERFGDDASPALAAEAEAYKVYQVRWPAMETVEGEGLLVQPSGKAVAHVVAIPDADQTPEQLMGLAPGLPPEQQWARRLAENGFELVIPVLVTRRLLETEDAQLKASEQTEREWIYRQAFHMGRHVIGFEVQKVSAAVDWFHAQHRGAAGTIGVAGYAEGGLIAFYAAAVDQRIDSALLSGYFDSRERVWSEPIYRNVWSLLKTFGDAEIASLILPRHLVIEHSDVSAITSRKGEWTTPDIDSVRREVHRIPVRENFPKPALFMGVDSTPTGPGSVQALEYFARLLGMDMPLPLSPTPPADRRKGFDPDIRRRRVLTNMEQHVQALVQASEKVRDEAFLYKVMPQLKAARWTTEPSLPVHDAAPFVEAAKAYRERFLSDGMGRFDEAPQPLNPRMRLFRESEKWTAWDVVLDVWPEVFAWGLLVLPKDIAADERRPVVVCQHGRNGLPRKTIDEGESGYGKVAARLAERGFIAFSPHNLYRGEDRYRWLSRKANTIQASLFSFIIAQHDAILRWLGSLPQVDPARIAFYGLSYGGETAVRVPSILENYALSICSGDFNQWTRKVASTSELFSFMRTIEWEMPYWNLGHTFDYAEMAYLIFPRPFMVERGHLDLVGRDQWVAHEYAKVRWLYAQLGLADRTAIEFFQGGHSLKQLGTVAFLHKHLRWPTP